MDRVSCQRCGRWIEHEIQFGLFGGEVVSVRSICSDGNPCTEDDRSARVTRDMARSFSKRLRFGKRKSR